MLLVTIPVVVVVVLLLILAFSLVRKHQPLGPKEIVLILAFLCFLAAVAGWPIVFLVPMVPLGLALWVLASLI